VGRLYINDHLAAMTMERKNQMKHTPPPHLGDAQDTGRRKADELRKKFPPYKIAPTKAVRSIGGFKTPVNPHLLSTKAEATVLARQLRKSLYQATGDRAAVNVYESMEYEGYVEWGDEKRRVWMLSGTYYPEFENNVGFLLIMKNASGVGAPGHFEYDDAAFGPVWKSDRKGD
jgi:hypothetical protein